MSTRNAMKDEILASLAAARDLPGGEPLDALAEGLDSRVRAHINGQVERETYNASLALEGRLARVEAVRYVMGARLFVMALTLSVIVGLAVLTIFGYLFVVPLTRRPGGGGDASMWLLAIPVLGLVLAELIGVCAAFSDHR